MKFKDAEMIGVPTIVVVGRDLASDGTVEVRDRASGERENVAVEAVVDHVVGSSGPRPCRCPWSPSLLGAPTT